MRKHSIANSRVTVVDALFPLVRQHILGTILVEPARWWYLSELAHHLGSTPSSLQREIPLLMNAGILEERQDGTRTYFRAQQASPAYRNLRGIFAKTQEARKKSQSRVPKRLSALRPLVSRELISRYNREELYQKVWSQPIQKLAPVYGLSDVRLGKVCRKLRIPTPGRGYWNKKNAGKPVGRRPPLPFVATVASETLRPLSKALPASLVVSSDCTASKPGKAMRLMCYPKPKLKAIMVEASRKARLSLSSFIIRSALERTAAMMKCDVTDLVSADELAQYV